MPKLSKSGLGRAVAPTSKHRCSIVVRYLFLLNIIVIEKKKTIILNNYSVDTHTQLSVRTIYLNNQYIFPFPNQVSADKDGAMKKKFHVGPTRVFRSYILEHLTKNPTLIVPRAILQRLGKCIREFELRSKRFYRVKFFLGWIHRSKELYRCNSRRAV